MKKCALFLMCCLFLASCSKNLDVSEPAFNPDRDLEAQIETDLSTVHAAISDYFKSLDGEQLLMVEKKLESGVQPAELTSQFAGTSFLNAQRLLADHLQSLSYRGDQDRFEAFLESIAGRQNTLVTRAFRTPCYNSWDTATAGVTASYLLCLSLAVDPISAGTCTAGAIIGYAVAELNYQNCMEQYE